MDCHLPGSSVPGILQARMLEWVAVPSSRGSSRPRDRTHVSYWQAGSLSPEPPAEHLPVSGASPLAQLVIYLQFRRRKRHRFSPCVGKLPCRRKWPPTLIFLPGAFHGQRSLAGYSPWRRKESDMTECLHTHTASLVTINFTFNVNTLQRFFLFFYV